jgi:hypothetical protein
MFLVKNHHPPITISRLIFAILLITLTFYSLPINMLITSDLLPYALLFFTVVSAIVSIWSFIGVIKAHNQTTHYHVSYYKDKNERPEEEKMLIDVTTEKDHDEKEDREEEKNSQEMEEKTKKVTVKKLALVYAMFIFATKKFIDSLKKEEEEAKTIAVKKSALVYAMFIFATKRLITSFDKESLRFLSKKLKSQKEEDIEEIAKKFLLQQKVEKTEMIVVKKLALACAMIIFAAQSLTCFFRPELLLFYLYETLGYLALNLNFADLAFGFANKKSSSENSQKNQKYYDKIVDLAIINSFSSIFTIAFYYSCLRLLFVFSFTVPNPLILAVGSVISYGIAITISEKLIFPSSASSFLNFIFLLASFIAVRIVIPIIFPFPMLFALTSTLLGTLFCISFVHLLNDFSSTNNKQAAYFGAFLLFATFGLITIAGTLLTSAPIFMVLSVGVLGSIAIGCIGAHIADLWKPKKDQLKHDDLTCVPCIVEQTMRLICSEVKLAVPKGTLFVRSFCPNNPTPTQSL